MDSQAFDKAVAGMMKSIGCLILLLIPFTILGGWKIVEIAIWVFNHVEVK